MKSFAASFFLTLSIAVPSLADSWPQWRGPRGDGVSTEKNLPTKWSKTQNVKWRCELPGQAGATPIVWKDRIFLTSADGNDLVLLCIQTTDGRKLWQKKIGAGNQDARAGEGNSASPSPSTDGEYVWCFFGTGTLACFTVDGQEVWKIDVNERFGKLDIQFGMTSTPVLDGEFLYLQLIHGPMKFDDATRIGKVIKLDKRTGATVWAVDRQTQAAFECKHSYASPFLYRDGSREFLVVHGADCITGHGLDDGKELWRFGQLNGPTKLNPKDNDPTFRFVASPLVVPGLIIVPTAKEGPVIALKVNDALHGDCSTNQEVIAWTNPRTPDVSIPLLVDGLVYLLHKDGRLQCLDVTTGKELYFARTYTGQHRTSPVYAGGNIYFQSSDGHCTVVKPGPQLEIVSTNELDEPITASTVVADGVLYIRSYQALYAIANP
ncbi:MAG: PQQ-binding-like beta-propeller repeat protein [Planctomycetota bacterium]|jgi:outer membrane protein assembly factor BamB